MKPRSSQPCAIALAVAIGLGASADPAFAQAGLRGSDDANAFPSSPNVSTPLSPESNSPPTLSASPASADESLPPVIQQSESRAAPNYGKPRKPKPKLYVPYSKSNPPLSPLVPYRGAPGPQRRVLNPVPAPKTEPDAVQPGPTVAVLPSPARPKKPVVELEPYAPVGVRIGDLRFLPFVETTTGYETNPNQVSVGVKPSPVLRAAGGFDMQSDFTNHSLTASLRGGYSDFPANTNANRPDASGVVDGRIDVTRDDRIITEARFSLATQTPGSPLLAVPNSVFIVTRPLISSEGATLGAAHTFNRLTLDLRGTFDRTQYGDALQSDGTIYRYSQDNYNDYGVVGRASYEVTPGVIPFAEVGVDSRVRDNAVDLSGYYRDSTGILGRAGSSFELSRILTGTISAGYADRHYADSRLVNLRGPTFDGNLVYAITPLTTITLRGNTTLSETTLAGASGAISRLVSLEIAHVFYRHFTLSATAAYQPNEYQGVSVRETFRQYTLKGAYAFSREVQLVASVSHQDLSSSLPGNTFHDTIFLVGARLQR